MATESVTLSMEEVRRIQDRLLVGLAAFAELKRVRDHLDIDSESSKKLCRSMRDAGAYPLLPAAGDDEVGEFATALHTLHIATTP